MSAWVNDALRLKADHDRRLRAVDEFVAAYEAEHGEITDEEMAEVKQDFKAFLKSPPGVDLEISRSVLPAERVEVGEGE